MFNTIELKLNYHTIEIALATLNKFTFVTGTLGLGISKTRIQMAEEATIFEQERDKLLKKYGTLDETTKKYKVEDTNSENYKKLMEELIPLLETECSITLYQVTREEFDKVDISNDKCDVDDYTLIEQLFVKKSKE